MSSHILMFHTITEVHSRPVKETCQEKEQDSTTSKVIISAENLLQALKAVTQPGESIVGSKIHLEIPGHEGESNFLKVKERLFH